MTSAIAKVTSAHARDVASAEAAHVTCGEVAAAESTHVASAEAAHMASAAHVAATTSVSAAATAAAGLCISGQKAAGKRCACQNHQHSSSHDILLWNGRDFPPQGLVRRWPSEETERQRRDGLKMGSPVCRLH
jgi:hypothetical protein